jgi:hypothetical protein
MAGVGGFWIPIELISQTQVAESPECDLAQFHDVRLQISALKSAPFDGSIQR